VNPDLITLFIGEIFIILIMYRFLLRQWVIEKWEEKIEEEGYLVIKLEPVIDAIEDRMHEKLEQFQSSFFGSVGAMTKKAQDLDPMNNIRKAAKAGDWTSMLVEYAANKANLGHLLPSESQNIGSNDSKINSKPQIPKKLLEK
tara:strand:+ start:320 stop:748 length:429 start_codon:yes stop_codon:yes gene_type:complete